jgi:ribonuclease D
MSVPPMSEEITTDSVLDAIALIEMQRQDLHRESDPEGWRNQALAKLQEILRQIEEALRQPSPSPEHHANAEAVRNAINRVKTRPGVAAQHPARDGTQRRQPQKSRPQQQRGGRRNTGRHSGR